MLLEGSCHCGVVTFSVESAHPYPFNYCYCSICRKTSGGGGYAINLGANASSLKSTGQQYVRIYYAKIKNEQNNKMEVSSAERHFCIECGTALWIYDSRWPDLIHPFASAIDTELPIAKERTHLMLASKASWVSIECNINDKKFPQFPEESIAEWHKRLNLERF